MSKKVCRPRKKPANNANPRTSAAVDVTALKRCVRVVAKGAEAYNLAKVNPAPFHAGRSLEERPKPFNTWDLLDFLQNAIQLIQAGVVNL